MTAELPRSRNWRNDRPPLVRMECADSLVALGTCQSSEILAKRLSKDRKFPFFLHARLPAMNHYRCAMQTSGFVLGFL